MMTHTSFSFDEVTHSYHLGEIVLPGVTTVLKETGFIDDQWFTDEGRLRGQAVHKAVYLLITDNLDYAYIHPLVKPHLEGVEEFIKTTGFKPFVPLCEKPQYHSQYLYAGTPDLVGVLNGRHVLIDLKTGAYDEAAHLQTSAYANFPEIAALRPDRFILKTFDDGRAKLSDKIEDPGHFGVFISALNIYNFRKSREVKNGSDSNTRH